MKQLITILEELHPDVDFSIEHALVTDGILDSFDMVSLVAEIEEAFGVVLTAEDLQPENFQSSDAIYRLILARS